MSDSDPPLDTPLSADDPVDVMAAFENALAWLQNDLLSPAVLLQLVMTLAAFALAWLAARLLRRRLTAGVKGGGEEELSPEETFRFRERVARLVLPVIWLLFQGVFLGAAPLFGVASEVLLTAFNLLAAWVIIGIVTLPIRNRFLSWAIGVSAWLIVALSILGVFDQTLAVLDQAAIPLGEDSRLSLLDILTVALTLVVSIWVAVAMAALAERQIAQQSSMNPSARVLLSKVLKFVLVALAIIVGVGAAGLDLTIFAVFGGAIGLGLGFGLQKVVSNLFSGFILLMDRSIKPGDVIETQDTYGWINRLATRYTSIITRDGTEYLIPNEDMITQPVINWSHSDRLVRQKVDFGISYDSDVDLARALAIEAAEETERVLPAPNPICLLMGFGDSSVDLQLRFWIDDPQNGLRNVASDVRLKIWAKFHEKGVRFPFPQRDVHLIDVPEGLFSREESPSKGSG